MQSTFQLFYEIALWRRGPRDVPASGSLLAVVAAVYVAISAVQSYLVYGPDGALFRGLADLVLTAVVFWVALAVARRSHRYLQTLTAILGTGALLAVPMILLLTVGQAVGANSPLAFLVSLASLPLLIWYLFVVGHVVREALESPLFTGMAVALTYFVLSYLALVQLLPGGSGG
jgi:hypothetical protein